ncbi:MAG: M23 family metallopeptidase [Clostridia bacterium]|nr:M23 family metallopeptidase [Clostridia bacterium]
MIKKWMETWGYYVLAVLCMAVIIFSAVWTRKNQDPLPNAEALSDGSQRLSDVTPQPTARPTRRPVDGPVLRSFSQAPVYFDACHLWRVHPATDFAVSPGDPVYTILGGTVEMCDGEVRVDHGNELRSVYRGVQEIQVTNGQFVRAGDVIARASSSVPFEGTGHVCVAIYQDDQPLDLEKLLDSPSQ